jgi:hypothetical protein
MDLGQIVYIVAIIGYFIYQATKKKKGLEENDMPESQPTQTERPTTFEDLLREIREAQRPPVAEKPKPAPIPVPSRPQQPVTYSQTKVQPRPRPVQVEEIDDEATFYEGSYSKGAKAIRPLSKMEEMPVMDFKKTVKYDFKEPKFNPYAEMLKNPKTIKQAIIVGEILKPKYF